MLLSIHFDDLTTLRIATSAKTPALNHLLDAGKTDNVSRVIQELRFIGRTGEKAQAEFARELVPSLLKASTLELEVGE